MLTHVLIRCLTLNELHPSKKIIGEESLTLRGKKIVLGVTASAAIYRSLDLARKLMRRGAEVFIVMSEESSRLIKPTLFKWATGNEVILDISGNIEHITLANHCDCFVIAPATLNTMAKIAWGISDTNVSLVAQAFLGASKPILIVPAMHIHLYKSPVMKQIMSKLQSMNNVSILEPLIVKDKAMFPPIEYIADKVEAIILRGEDLRNYSILVTAGPTREYIDPIRFISNPSSGRMGVSIAAEAFYRGAYVELIHGPLSIEVPPWITNYSVESTEDMLERVKVQIALRKFDIIILAAAPADFKPSESYGKKLESDRKITLELVPTPKIAKSIREIDSEIFLVGFAAETVDTNEELMRRAKEKMEKYKFDIVVANIVGRPGLGFGSEYNEVVLIHRDGEVKKYGPSLKREIARFILDEILRKIRFKNTNSRSSN